MEKTLFDDLIHEIAHSIEEPYMDMKSMETKRFEKEFLKKRSPT